MRKIEIDSLHCLCADNGTKDRVAYILYPMDILADWIGPASIKYGVTIVVITGMDWQNVFSPWPARGVPAGSPDFAGKSPDFLSLLQTKVIPQIESDLFIDKNVRRTLVGVSMSGLFALWQWMVCDTFFNIASLSGSFWYEGFLEWMQGLKIPTRQGRAFFLLGDRESKSSVKAFDTVGRNTNEIISLLDKADYQPPGAQERILEQ